MVQDLVQAWTVPSKWVAGNHEGVCGPGELKGPLQDLIFPLGIGFKDLSELVV